MLFLLIMCYSPKFTRISSTDEPSDKRKGESCCIDETGFVCLKHEQ